MIATGLLATGLLEGEYLKALVGAAIIGVVAPVVGTWIVLRRMANLGDTMSHGTLAGVGIATRPAQTSCSARSVPEW